MVGTISSDFATFIDNLPPEGLHESGHERSKRYTLAPTTSSENDQLSLAESNSQMLKTERDTNIVSEN